MIPNPKPYYFELYKFESFVTNKIKDGQQKSGHKLMVIILSNLNRFTHFLLEDSVVNLNFCGY